MIPLHANSQRPSAQSREDLITSRMNLSIFSGFRIQDLVSQIDSFYFHSANIKNPVLEAYRYVSRKIKGASTDELSGMASDLRCAYNK